MSNTKTALKLFKTSHNRPTMVTFFNFFGWVVAHPTPWRAPPLIVGWLTSVSSTTSISLWLQLVTPSLLLLRSNNCVKVFFYDFFVLLLSSCLIVIFNLPQFFISCVWWNVWELLISSVPYFEYGICCDLF